MAILTGIGVDWKDWDWKKPGLMKMIRRRKQQWIGHAVRRKSL